MPKLQLCLQPDQSLEQPHSGRLYPTLWPRGQELACQVSTKGIKQRPTLRVKLAVFLVDLGIHTDPAGAEVKGSLAQPLPKAHFLLWAGPIELQSKGRKKGRGDRWRDSAHLKCA